MCVRHDASKRASAGNIGELTVTTKKRTRERGSNMRKKNLRVMHKQVYDRVQVQQVRRKFTATCFHVLFSKGDVASDRFSRTLRAKPILNRHWRKLGQNA